MKISDTIVVNCVSLYKEKHYIRQQWKILLWENEKEDNCRDGRGGRGNRRFTTVQGHKREPGRSREGVNKVDNNTETYTRCTIT